MSGSFNQDFSPAGEIFGKDKIFLFIGAALLLALPFETTPLPIQAQVMPLASILALLFLPFAVRQIPRTPLFTAVICFAGFVLLHSTIGLLIDALRGESMIRFVAWLRQIVALVAGLALFLTMRKAWFSFSDRRIIYYLVIGAIPSLLLALLHILWGAFKQPWAGNIVLAIRKLVAPLGYTAPMRASGFASEPSTFASYLAIVMVPALFVLLNAREHRRGVMVLLVVTLAAFGWAFSTTGFLILFFMFLATILFGPNRKFMLKLALGFFLLMLVAFWAVPNSQMIRHASMLIAGKANLNLSFNDRFYSTFGPFINSFSSWTMLGYGLGGTATHFSEMLPKDIQADIVNAKWKGMPNLATLIGRVFAETGIVGFILFMSIFGLAIWQLRTVLRFEASPYQRLFLFSARLGLIGAFTSLIIAFGSFHIPYLWLWLALIDSRYARWRDANHPGEHK